MVNFLLDYQYPCQWSKDKRRQLALRSRKFTIIDGRLYKKGVDQIIRRCEPEHEKLGLFQEAHEGIARGYLEREGTMTKVL